MVPGPNAIVGPFGVRDKTKPSQWLNRAGFAGGPNS